MGAAAVFEAFGLHWRSDIELSGFDPASSGCRIGKAVIDVSRVDSLAARHGGRPVNRGFVYPDGIRIGWGREVAFDMTGGTRIDYCPGEAWAGRLPAFFYSTVAALTLAWRGLVPFHACAVEYDGQAILIAGAPGAGKSTLTAGLLNAGAYFVGDDLTVIERNGEGTIRVLPGRPTIRLHRDTAATVASSATSPVEGDPRDKWLVRPKRRSVADGLPLGAVLLLDGDAPRSVNGFASDRLLTHVFSRRWMAALPMRAHIIGTGLVIPRMGVVRHFPTQRFFNPADQRSRVDEALDLVRFILCRSGVRVQPEPGTDPPDPPDPAPEEAATAERIITARA